MSITYRGYDVHEDKYTYGSEFTVYLNGVAVQHEPFTSEEAALQWIDDEKRRQRKAAGGA